MKLRCFMQWEFLIFSEFSNKSELWEMSLFIKESKHTHTNFYVFAPQKSSAFSVKEYNNKSESTIQSLFYYSRPNWLQISCMLVIVCIKSMFLLRLLKTSHNILSSFFYRNPSRNWNTGTEFFVLLRKIFSCKWKKYVSNSITVMQIFFGLILSWKWVLASPFLYSWWK